MNAASPSNSQVDAQSPRTGPLHTGPTLTGPVSKLLRAAVLPKTVSAFEQSYLRRMNRVALMFFYAHLPAFMVVAWANGTGVLSVALMTLAVLAVPTLGCRALRSERAKSYVFAFTAMCMGGVLVHAGQGPVQIEMHFYFFSVLAMLALFANPMTVIVGAATVAVHHLALWYLAPASVFNYDAPLWVVLVHAGFVILETFAAGFIARVFFDNVIGLEKKVEERTAQLEERNQEMKVVLDSIEQGIVSVDSECRLLPEHSSAIEDFFGEFSAGETFVDFLSRCCVTTAEWFSMNWDALGVGFLPLELAVDQLPKSARIEGRTFEFSYRPELDEAGELVTMMIVVSDTTSDVERARAESLQRELLVMLERAMKDQRGFAAFYSESSALLAAVSNASPADPTAGERRALHTMKGNAGAFGLGSVSSACHSLEEAWADVSATASAVALATLEDRWTELGETATRLLGGQDAESLNVEAVELERLMTAATEVGATEVVEGLASLLLEPTSPALERLEAQALQLADRLERSPLQASFVHNGARVPRGAFQPFWSALVHVIRNAIDHGIELPEERLAVQKAPSGTVSVSTEVVDSWLVVSVKDDGRGIDWDLVRSKAQEHGLPHSSSDDLIDALFAAEVTTRESVSEVSGRGVGLSAVEEAVRLLGGSTTVVSVPNEGTTMQFKFPLDGVPVQPTAA